ncbi:hypothetical protein [Kitasatospora sp. NPDC091276]|uniref:hypothetical protein n=1 Tax=unclassified Kitasatospora TaxID=2633591 RepID=UPI00341B5199
MTSPPDPLRELAVGLAELRGDVGTGLAEIKGSLALLRQSDSHTGQTIADHSAQLADHDRRISDGERERAAAGEVRQADRRRLQALAGLAGVAAAVAAVVPIVNR